MGTGYGWHYRSSPKDLNVAWQVLDEIEEYFRKKFSRRAVGFHRGSVAYNDNGDVLDSPPKENKIIMEKAEVLELIKGDKEKFLEEIETRIAIYRVSQ